MSIYKRKIKVRNKVSGIDSPNFINLLKDNTKAVSISVAAIVALAGVLSYGLYTRKKKNLELSDRLYSDFNNSANTDLDQVRDYLTDYKGNTADMGRLFLAKGYYEAGRYDEALSVYKELSKMTSEPRFKVSAYLGMGHSNQSLGKYQEAVDAFKLAFDNAKEDPYKVEAKLSLGLAYESLGKKEEAAGHYKWLKDNFPNSQFVSPAFVQK